MQSLPSFFVSEEYLVEKLIAEFDLVYIINTDCDSEVLNIDYFEVFKEVRNGLRDGTLVCDPFMRFLKSSCAKCDYNGILENDEHMAAFYSAVHYYFGY